jgi:ATPase subunit of ABC transporter with duplicated ATPase domains
MDEPTNDLDIETLELLEELLASYPGTLLLVSHDRRLLETVRVNRRIAVDAGQVAELRCDLGWSEPC